MSLAGLESTTGTATYVAVGEPDSYAAADLADLTWAKVVGTVSFGSWGNEEQDVNEPLLEEGQVIHTNGVADGGTVAIGIQHRDTDAGSDIIKANSGADTQVSVMKVYRSGEGEVATGVFKSPKFRDATGQTVRGYTASLMVNTAVTELSSADVATALA